MYRGYIKLHRKIINDGLYQQKPFSKIHAWIDLIIMANHKTNNVYFHQRIECCGRGQLITSQVKLAEKWGWSRCKVQTYLKSLQKVGKILSNSLSKRFIKITICNYEIYQENENKNKQENRLETIQEKGKRKARERQEIGTNKNDKNIYKNKFLDCIFLTEDEEKKIRESYGNNFELAIEILNDYIMTKEKNPYPNNNHYYVLRGKNSWVRKEIIKLEGNNGKIISGTSHSNKRSKDKSTKDKKQKAKADQIKHLLVDESPKKEVCEGVWLTDEQEKYLKLENLDMFYNRLRRFKVENPDSEIIANNNDFKIIFNAAFRNIL
jgi:hypothetical protein